MKIHDLKLQIFPFAVSTLLSAWTALKFHKRTCDEEYIIISIETQKTTYTYLNTYYLIEQGENFQEYNTL